MNIITKKKKKTIAINRFGLFMLSNFSRLKMGGLKIRTTCESGHNPKVFIHHKYKTGKELFEFIVNEWSYHKYNINYCFSVDEFNKIYHEVLSMMNDIDFNINQHGITFYDNRESNETTIF